MLRLGNVLYNIYDFNTGETVSYTKTTVWLDGSAMSDPKCDGVIFRKLNNEYFKRNYTGPVNVKWFGAKGDGVTDDSSSFQRAINAFSGYGVDILVPSGTFVVGDINVPSSTKIYSNQIAKLFGVTQLQSKIIPLSSAEYIFYFEDNCHNSTLQGIYTESTGNTTLTAAIRFTGNGCRLYECLFNANPQYGVISSAGNSYIEKCGIFGWYGVPPTFTGLNDFRGALQIEALGDSYIMDNEIGAGLPYFQHYDDPMDMLRDPINRRICSLAATGFLGTSVISGNLFENGDRGVVLAGGGLYCTFHNNRYELSGGTGLTVTNQQIQFFSFVSERFSDNSLAGDGVFDDIVMDAGTAGHISFISPIFERLQNISIPTSTFRVRYNVSNFASTEISMVDEQVDPTYSLLGLINTTDPSTFLLKRAVLQYDPNNPLFDSVSTQNLPSETQKGYVKLTQGTDSATGLCGGIQFYKYDDTPIALLGFNASPDFVITMSGSGGIFYRIGGDLYDTKAGGITHTISSADDAGSTVFRLSGGSPENRATTFTLDTTGICTIVGSGDIVIGNNNGGNMLFDNNGTNFIPSTPNSSNPSDSSILGRDNTTGEIVTVTGGTVNTIYTADDTITSARTVTLPSVASLQFVSPVGGKNVSMIMDNDACSFTVITDDNAGFNSNFGMSNNGLSFSASDSANNNASLTVNTTGASLNCSNGTTSTAGITANSGSANIVYNDFSGSLFSTFGMNSGGLVYSTSDGMTSSIHMFVSPIGALTLPVYTSAALLNSDVAGNIGFAVQQAAIANIVSAPTASDYNNLLTVLRNLGLIAP